MQLTLSPAKSFTEEFATPHTETPIDHNRLRAKRLSRVQHEMEKRDIAGLLLTNPVHIRYTTGVAVMQAWTSVNLARYAFIPAAGAPVIFEYGKALFRAQRHWPLSRKAATWQYRFAQHNALKHADSWAKEIRTLLRQSASSRTSLRLGVDCLDFYGFRALLGTDIDVCDADEPMQAARMIKTDDEIQLLKQSVVVAETALYDLEQAIRPGISENELLGIFYKTMLAMGGEHCSTRLLVSGEKTNPWFYEAGTRKVRPNDLVAIDTDMVGPDGYLCDISRTFLCGERANGYQKEAFNVAREFIAGVAEHCKAGVSFRELAAAAPDYPRDYQELCYSCMIHGVGCDDEPPFLPYPHMIGQLGESVIPDGVLQTNMVLSIEFYAGKPGAEDGVKLEDQILITDSGPVWLSRYPLERRLMD